MLRPRMDGRATRVAALLGTALLGTGLLLSSLSGAGGPDLVAHMDAAPPGVVLGTAPATGELHEVVAADEFTVTVGTDAPAGRPGLATLSRHVAPSCAGTGADGNRVQVIYAVESGRKDRYSALLPQLRSWVADVDDTFAISAAKTSPGGPEGSRRVRWVHRATAGGCTPVISHVVLPAGSLRNGFPATVKALKAKGYTSPARKYLVFADAANLCGIGGMYVDTEKQNNANDGDYPTYARVDSPCWAFQAGFHSVAAHELMHMLGGVQDNAPHSTGAGHCVDETDAMCYDDGGLVSTLLRTCSGKEALFDCRNDDYFSLSPKPGSYLATHWNAADSSFLDRVNAAGAAPALAIIGPPAVRAGVAGTFRAVTSAKNMAFRWTASPASCVTGSRTATTLTVKCPSSFTGAVRLTLAGAAPGKDTATDSRTVVRGPQVGNAVRVARG